MRTSTALSLFFAATGTQVAAQSSSTVSSAVVQASEVNNNPAGKAYKATLPEEAFFKDAYPEGGNAKGEISAVSGPDGHGVLFKVKFSNLPKTGGPFTYHLHAFPVPEDGNCTETKAHLDPYERGQEPPCDKEDISTCEVGDLSGKYGSIPEGEDSFVGTYTDKYASTLEGLGSFFGNRSFVLHYANKTRISCANFELVAEGDYPTESDCSSTVESPSSTAAPVPSSSANGTVPSGTGSAPTFVPTPTPSQGSPVPAGASQLVAGGVSTIALAAAIMFML